jgi:hypothetical protein
VNGRRPDVLRTNLSTRPFYNERLVRLVLLLVAAFAVGLGVFDAVQILRLRARSADVRADAEAAEQEAARLRDQARAIRQTINREELDAVQVAAREANQLIDRRTFSWTDLFNRFEATLPPDVRIAAVQPQVDTEGRMLVAVTVVSRRVEDLDMFIEALEKTRAFRDVLPRTDEALEDGTLRSVIQGYYAAAADPPETGPAPNDPAASPAPAEARVGATP